MWQWVANLVTGGLLTAYQKRLEAGNTSERIASELAGKEVALQQRESELQTQLRIAQIGHWYEPEKLMGYAVAIYFGKLLIWDKVLGLGVTDPLAGWASTTANLIVAAYFGKRGIENVARILKGGR